MLLKQWTHSLFIWQNHSISLHNVYQHSSPLTNQCTDQHQTLLKCPILVSYTQTILFIQKSYIKLFSGSFCRFIFSSSLISVWPENLIWYRDCSLLEESCIIWFRNGYYGWQNTISKCGRFSTRSHPTAARQWTGKQSQTTTKPLL